MTAQCVEEGRKGKAHDGSDKEAEENELFFQVDVEAAGIAERLDVEDDGDDHESDEANQMCPDVTRFSMDSKD